MQGIGKPEPLKHGKLRLYSRRIDCKQADIMTSSINVEIYELSFSIKYFNIIIYRLSYY
ncbi:MAG: type II toxin-antitoxin system YoeB family toxin [Lachnospiraceae bacterium]|nr:type II toxin-antitoxin system YoeB family toxin [Lachnospiraceae bacterium]